MIWGKVHLVSIPSSNNYTVLFITCYHVPTHAVPASVLSNLQSWALIIQEMMLVLLFRSVKVQGCQRKFSGKPFVSMVIFMGQSHAKTSTEMVWL